MRWRHIPLSLRVAIVLQLATLVVRMTTPFAIHLGIAERIVGANASLRYAVHVLFVIGALDLSRQLMGRARHGAQIAFVAALLDLALELLWSVMVVDLSWFRADAWNIVLGYGNLVASLGLMAGFVVAAWGRYTMLAVVGIVVGLVTTPPPFLVTPVYQALGLGITAGAYFHVALEILRTAMVLVLALAASTEPPTPTPTPTPVLAERGFRRASRALWLRVIAVGLVPVLTLLAALGRSGDMTAVVKTATVASVVVGVVSLTQFAVGTIGVAHAQLTHLRALPLYASGVGALVCAGFAMLQTQSMFEYDRYLAERAAMWSFAAPLVAIGSLWCLRLAIIEFATHQRFLALRARASGRGGGACGLLLASLVITSWMIPGVGSVGGILFLMLVSLACSLGGTVILANLCAAAGESVRDVPALPTATAM